MWPLWGAHATRCNRVAGVGFWSTPPLWRRSVHHPPTCFGPNQLGIPRAHPVILWPFSHAQVDFSPKDLSQVATFLPKDAAAKLAPVQQYACTLIDRARQRIQMRLADSVELGEGQAGGDDGRWVHDGWGM